MGIIYGGQAVPIIDHSPVKRSRIEKARVPMVMPSITRCAVPAREFWRKTWTYSTAKTPYRGEHPLLGSIHVITCAVDTKVDQRNPWCGAGSRGYGQRAIVMNTQEMILRDAIFEN